MASASLLSRKRERSDGGEQEGVPSRQSKWCTVRAHESYSSKLIDALRLVRAAAGGAPRGHEVRHAAAARGRSRWSRAIILSRQRRRSTTHILRRAHTGPRASTRCMTMQVAAGKARVLGRLVPGCRKLPLPVLLAEVSDYIAAPQMQVRAMNAVKQAPCGGASSPS
jgi:hypothetical protein